ncbi:MAG: hypothetical protein ACE5FT_02170 [Candidatus Nanoarchaeia archaeon]
MRGRPVHSEIRDKIIEVLHHMGRGYGYIIHKAYSAIYGSVSREIIYYHLKKGVELGEFEVEKVAQEPGEYSWGRTVEKIYYRLGPNAHPKGDKKVREWFEKTI